MYLRRNNVNSVVEVLSDCLSVLDSRWLLGLPNDQFVQVLLLEHVHFLLSSHTGYIKHKSNSSLFNYDILRAYEL